MFNHFLVKFYTLLKTYCCENVFWVSTRGWYRLLHTWRAIWWCRQDGLLVGQSTKPKHQLVIGKYLPFTTWVAQERWYFRTITSVFPALLSGSTTVVHDDRFEIVAFLFIFYLCMEVVPIYFHHGCRRPEGVQTNSRDKEVRLPSWEELSLYKDTSTGCRIRTCTFWVRQLHNFPFVINVVFYCTHVLPLADVCVLYEASDLLSYSIAHASVRCYPYHLA